MATLRVLVKQPLCTGEALCTGIAPQYFELITDAAGDHKAKVKGTDGKLHEEFTFDVDEDEYDDLLEAAERCPPCAIFVYEIDGAGEEAQIFP